VVHFIVEKIKDKDIMRRFDGGVNLMIRWIPRLPKDVDIRTNQVGYDIFRKTFLWMKKKEWQTQKREILWYKHYIIFDVQWIEVEVAYYEEENKNMDMFDYIIEKDRDNIKIPVLPLTQMKEFYENIWSTEKVKIIEDFILNHNNNKHDNKLTLSDK
jgi:hypothetical protein